MPFFLYQARDKKGNLIKGQIEAPNTNSAADILMARQEIPIKITLTDEDQNKDIFKGYFERVKIEDLVVFSRQMYSLTKSGIPMIRAIVGLADTTTNKTLKRILNDVAVQLERGRSLSAAFSSHGKVFPRIAISIVHVGENTGRLESSFLQLAEYFERDEETKKRINSAIRYPQMVLFFITAAMFLLNLKVIPTFTGMFAKLGADLPLATKILIATSTFFVTYWEVLVLAIVGGIFFLRSYVATKAGRYQWDHYKIKMPFVGSIIERSLLARFSRSFSMILDAGVPMNSGLSLVAEAVDNSYMETKIKEMRTSIEKGESLLRSAVASKLFSPLVLQMIAVGEETGRVDELLTDAADYYEREVDFDLKSLTAKIEPVLISVVAGMVLVLALGIFTPMWDMMSAHK
ncbi:MAG: MSHA biogenesis protein MshG [Psychrosphaera sp.]|jgi:MSHA biogenesis protein MshG